MSDSDSDLKTDALPSPPRNPKNKENIYAQNGSQRKPKKTNEKKEQIEENCTDTDPGEPKGNSYEKPVVNVIQIIYSPNTHVGNTYYHNFPKKSNRQTPRENKEISGLKQNHMPVLDKDINIVKDYIGYKDGWEDTFIQLGFTHSQIQQHQYKFERDFNGLIAYLLLDWRQANGKEATVCTLANVLWDTNQHEALLYWSSKYDLLHKNDK